ncbi:hypothetical protein POPTR_008G136533v4 [Populus trichocarpa]|uniref:Uncharacterized protein n=1 Tax=Populus trichocarpa TaxID=3694 RepID=A0ACC0SLK9_POPTR|nr:hypothetical protein POPTR_008G136533v4 [Populus trichocarpa]
MVLILLFLGESATRCWGSGTRPRRGVLVPWWWCLLLLLLFIIISETKRSCLGDEYRVAFYYSTTCFCKFSYFACQIIQNSVDSMLGDPRLGFLPIYRMFPEGENKYPAFFLRNRVQLGACCFFFLLSLCFFFEDMPS